MEREEIIAILDNIDSLMLNGLNESFRFIDPLKCQAVANEVSKLPRLDELEENSVLYKRIRAVNEAFYRAANGRDNEVNDYSQYYFKWLEGEKDIATGKKIGLREAVNLSANASVTGHEDNNKVKEVLDSSIMFGSNKNNLPKKITWIDKLKMKLNKIFKKDKIIEETNKPEIKPSLKDDRSQFLSSVGIKDIDDKQPIEVKQNPDIVVIGDLHGDIRKWQYVKNAMKSNPELKIIIEGDAMDRGAFGLQILMQIKELCDQGRAEYLPGNHDMFAYYCLKTEGTEYEEYDGVQDAKKMWEMNGGKVTNKSFEDFINIMNNEIKMGNIKRPISKEELIEWLGTRPIQKALTVNGNNYALGHAIFDEELYKFDPNFNLYKGLVKELRGEKDIIYQRYLNSLWYREDDENTHYAPLAIPQNNLIIVGHTRNKELLFKNIGNEEDKPVFYTDCGLGELQGFSLTTMKTVQLEPKDKVLTK